MLLHARLLPKRTLMVVHEIVRMIEAWFWDSFLACLGLCFKWPKYLSSFQNKLFLLNNQVNTIKPEKKWHVGMKHFASRQPWLIDSSRSKQEFSILFIPAPKRPPRKRIAIYVAIDSRLGVEKDC